jgi:hypothetical protein
VPVTHGSYYEVRPPALDGTGEISLRDLVKFVLTNYELWHRKQETEAPLEVSGSAMRCHSWRLPPAGGFQWNRQRFVIVNPRCSRILSGGPRGDANFIRPYCSTSSTQAPLGPQV